MESYKNLDKLYGAAKWGCATSREFKASHRRGMFLHKSFILHIELNVVQ